jgi:hypothetical protein
MIFPFSFVKKTSVGGYVSIVSGADGDLIINNGQTVNIAAGSVLQYNSVTINSGGALNIIASTTFQKTEIGCKNGFVLNGTITAKCDPLGIGGAISGSTTIGGKPYTKTITQALGGSGTADFSHTPASSGGGSGNSFSTPPLGGDGTNGFGGGGAGSSNGAVLGGSGGSGGNSGSNAPSSGGTGGAGNSTLGTGGRSTTINGGAGGGSGGGGGYVGGGAGGGGGGMKGAHGQYLFVYIEGVISGSGSIDTSGTNGFNGHLGATDANGITGGSGGGGAGGSGGYIDIWKKSTSTVTFSNSVAGGALGIGANPGPFNDSTRTSGGNGFNGSSGTVVTNTIP